MTRTIQPCDIDAMSGFSEFSEECRAADDAVCMYCKWTIRHGAMAIRCHQDDWQIEAFGLDKRLWHPECWGQRTTAAATGLGQDIPASN